MEFASGTRLGKYTILDKLGEGAQGAVFEAQDDLNKRVALKILDGRRASTEERKRFVQEAKLICRVQEHPGIVMVFDSGEINEPMGRFDKLIYIAMQRLRGEPLASYIAKHKDGLDPKIACELAWQMADALCAAHAEQVIHRDLKPANVFVVTDKATYLKIRTKILDFGLGKQLGSPVSRSLAVDTHLAAVGGTPMYMSPEQWTSIATVDQRTDIYALGCILFEMLTARTPFTGVTIDELRHQHLHAPPPPLDADTVGRDVCTLVEQMLAKKPDDRIPTMEAAADVLDRARMRMSKSRRAVVPEDVTPIAARESADPLVAPTVAPTIAPTIIGLGPPPATPRLPVHAAPEGNQHQMIVESSPEAPPVVLPPDTLPGLPPALRGTQPAGASAREPIEEVPHGWPEASLKPTVAADAVAPLDDTFEIDVVEPVEPVRDDAIARPPRPPRLPREAEDTAPVPTESEPDAWMEWQERAGAEERRRRDLWRAVWVWTLALGCGGGLLVVTQLKPWESKPAATSSIAMGDKKPDPIDAPPVADAAVEHSVVASDGAMGAPDFAPQIYPVPVGAGYVEGPSDAPVTMIVAGEYSCKHCETMRGPLQELRRRYSRSLRIVHEQYVVYPTGTVSAFAICAADKQGAHEAFETYLWENGLKHRSYDVATTTLPDGATRACWDAPAGCSIVVSFASAVGLDVPRFKADMRGCVAEVQATQQQLAAFGITGVPAIFINGRRGTGAFPADVLSKVIDEELTTAEQRIARGTARADYYETWVLSAR